MKRTVFILSLVGLFSLTGIAQTKNVDIDNVGFYYTYIKFPTKPIDPIEFTYTSKVTAAGVVLNNISAEEIEDAMFIDGQIRVEGLSEAQIILELKLGNIIILNSSVSERKEEHKDKDGKVTGVSYYYRSVIRYTFESSFVYRKGEEVLKQGNVYSRQTENGFSSEEYGSRKGAADFWNNNKESLVSSFYRDLSLKSAAFVSGDATSLYGFKPIRANDILKTMDEKKHNENIPFRAAVDTLKAELQAMTQDTPLNREKIESVINYFKSIPEKYTDQKHKADVRLRYAAWYNLCKIYLNLDEPENVEQYANKISSNGYDEKDGDRLLKEAIELKASFTRTNIRTRHFNPDIYFAPKE
jgi:hypothetical protein